MSRYVAVTNELRAQITNGGDLVISEIETVDNVNNIVNPISFVQDQDGNGALGNINEVGTVSNITTGNLNSIATITNPIEVNEVQNVVSVDLVDQVTNVDLVDQVDEVVNVSNVDFVPDPRLELFLGNYLNWTGKQLYSRGTTNGPANWLTIMPDGDNIIKPLIPSPGIQLAMSCENALDTTSQIIVQYFANPTDTTSLAEIVTLNGQTKVTLTAPQIYRIQNIALSGSTLPPADTNVYLYDNALVPVAGIPASWYDFIKIGPGTDPEFENARATAIYYTPPGTLTFFNSWIVSADNQNNDVRQIAFALYNPSALAPIFRNFYIGDGLYQYNQPGFGLPGGFTFQVLCKEASGANNVDIQFNAEIIEYTLP